MIVGKGKRLFNGHTNLPLRLTDTVTTGKGVAVLTYAKAA